MNDTLVALLKGDAIPWSAVGMPADEFLAQCRDRDLICLVGERVRSSPAWREWPQHVCETLRAIAYTQTAQELLNRKELLSVFDALAGEGIAPIVTKGTALAYTFYRLPAERPRIDTDLLIRRGDVDRIRGTMAGLGYAAPPYCDGELFGQFPMRKIDAFGLTHTLDFHWKISTQPVFADVLDFAEVAAEAIDVPALGRHARMPSLVHTLLLACIHPAMHHRNAELLIWTYDVHLVASRLSTEDFERFVELAINRRVAAICAQQLAAARARFATPVSDAVLGRLNANPGEPSSEYLRPNRRWRDEFISSLRALPRWRDRSRLVREVMFPGPSYMLAAYRITRRSPAALLLPGLYVHRLMAGAWKVLRGRK